MASVCTAVFARRWPPGREQNGPARHRESSSPPRAERIFSLSASPRVHRDIDQNECHTNDF
jgi:hypothetical protein